MTTTDNPPVSVSSPSSPAAPGSTQRFTRRPSTRGVQLEDVLTAADEIVAKGQKPTIERVRQHLGSGSPNTVSPMLDVWFERLPQRLGGGLAAPQALLFAASFYRACGETLAWCRKIQGAPNSSPTLPFGSSDRSSTLDDSFHRQALSPCWTRILLQDANANADARMLRQIGTLTATAKVVHALRDWRWEPSSRAGDDPVH